MAPTVTAPDGVTISYDVSGSGTPALVFVHGWSCDRGYWRRQAAHFGEHHTVVTIDLAGHGDSGDDLASWALPAFGGDGVAVVETLDLPRVVLVGHSFGGDVVVDAALRLGDRVTAVVWVDTYRTLGDIDSPEDVARFVQQFRDDFAGDGSRPACSGVRRSRTWSTASSRTWPRHRHGSGWPHSRPPSAASLS